MKKKFITFAAICLAAIACTKETPVTSDKSDTNAPTVTAGIVDEDATKTNLNGLNVTWSAGDQIKVISHDDWLTSSKPYGTYTLATGAGTKSATFEMTSGSAPVVTTTNKYYAIYNGGHNSFFNGGGQSTRKDLYAWYTLPGTQNYVANGIEDGLLSMWGYGTSLDDIQFHHNTGIVSLRLYADAAGTFIDHINITTQNICAGQFYHNFYSYPNAHFFKPTSSSSNTTCITYTIAAPVELSTSSESPTCFNIVLPAYDLGYLSFSIYDENDNIMQLHKSRFNVSPGVKYTMSAQKFVPISIPQVFIKVGENEPVNIYSYTGTPTGSVTITACQRLTDEDLYRIAAIIGKNAVNLDLSSISIPNDTFLSWFKNCDNLQSILLPTSLTIMGGGSCILSSNFSGTVTIPEGVTTINNSCFLGPEVALVLPSTLTSIDIGNNYTITSFAVSAYNPNFSSQDGVLFNQDKTKLVYYPGRNTAISYTIPNTVQEVGEIAFHRSDFLESLIVPASVLSMRRPFSYSAVLNSITLQGPSTVMSSATVDDSNIGNLISVHNGVINVPTGCSNYRNGTNGAGWTALAGLGWTINDGTTKSTASASIGALGTSSPSFEW